MASGATVDVRRRGLPPSERLRYVVDLSASLGWPNTVRMLTNVVNLRVHRGMTEALRTVEGVKVWECAALELWVAR